MLVGLFQQLRALTLRLTLHVIPDCGHLLRFESLTSWPLCLDYFCTGE